MHVKNVLVIGASRGIGLELVRQFASAGWRVYATTRTARAPGVLGQVAGDVRIHELDVQNAASIAKFAKALGNTPLDMAIHNAGISDRGHDRDTVFAVNAQAPFDVTNAILDNLRLTNEPRLLLMTSQLGARRGSTRSLGVYGDSKAELNDRFREHAPSWKEQGITAIVMHPGWVRTDMGGPSAPLTVQESARGIRQVMCNLAPQDHGRFMTWKGQDHPW